MALPLRNGELEVPGPRGRGDKTYGQGMASELHWTRDVRTARLKDESDSEDCSESAAQAVDMNHRSEHPEPKRAGRRDSPSSERSAGVWRDFPGAPDERERSRSRALPLEPRDLLLWEEQLMARQRQLDEMERQYRSRGRRHKRRRAVPEDLPR
eukprot:CAMPEP_0114642606 /NCGR_PEP_ID=MMETSP0191-20121206/2916_1 /TAXON_ID=126664 /ORGANISM="Sorites sp." /LENGTH=153 /DNA_ID=CAMNT_0001854797 /DNA_START=13 /DNA_END=474 /DNA_ORIENTATION=+